MSSSHADPGINIQSCHSGNLDMEISVTALEGARRVAFLNILISANG